MKEVKVGIIGWGTVGNGVVKLITEKKEEIERKSGVRIILKKVCDIDLERERDVKLPPPLLTTDAQEVINDPEIDVVVELIGGIHPAREYILKALEKKKKVVTANKALLAEEGKEIFEKARETGKGIYFEASVMAGVPILKSLKEGLVANDIDEILGIINGTTNYILSSMEKGKTYTEALKEAQKKGFAESDPTLDVEGWDSAHKLCILTYLSFGVWPPLDKLLVEGITGITPLDLEYAKQLGYSIKLLAVGKKEKGNLQLRVSPTLIPLTHPLASVRDEYNALFVKGDAVGGVTFQGKGAGSLPTASGVLSDIIDTVKNAQPWLPEEKQIPLLNPDDMVLSYYLRFTVVDKPGVLSSIAGILGKRRISIESVVQKGRRVKGTVPVIMMTHEAREGDVREALKEIDSLPVVKKKTLLIRVEKYTNL